MNADLTTPLDRTLPRTFDRTLPVRAADAQPSANRVAGATANPTPAADAAGAALNPTPASVIRTLPHHMGTPPRAGEGPGVRSVQPPRTSRPHPLTTAALGTLAALLRTNPSSAALGTLAALLRTNPSSAALGTLAALPRTNPSSAALGTLAALLRTNPSSAALGTLAALLRTISSRAALNTPPPTNRPTEAADSPLTPTFPFLFSLCSCSLLSSPTLIYTIQSAGQICTPLAQ